MGTYFWHIDGTTGSTTLLPKASLLTPVRVAPKGGQTEFANMYAAFEGLPQAEQADLAGLRAVHRLSAALRGIFDYVSQEERDRHESVAASKELPIV